MMNSESSLPLSTLSNNYIQTNGDSNSQEIADQVN
jgi:hypothetical protein